MIEATEKKKNKRVDNNSFEVMAAAQWNQNRNRFEYIMNVISELTKLLGLTIDPNDGSFMSYDPTKCKLPFSIIPDSPSAKENMEEIGKLIKQYVESGLMGYFNNNKIPIRIQRERATVDESVHIANNQVLVDRMVAIHSQILRDFFAHSSIAQEIMEDNSVIYRIDKEGRKKKLIDKQEKERIEFEKKPKLVQMFITQVNTVKRILLFYLLLFALIMMTLWDLYLLTT